MWRGKRSRCRLTNPNLLPLFSSSKVSHKIKSSNSAENIIGQLRRMPNKSEILIIIPLHYTTYSSYTISVKFELCHISSCLITHTAVEKRGMGRKSGNHFKNSIFTFFEKPEKIPTPPSGKWVPATIIILTEFPFLCHHSSVISWFFVCIKSFLYKAL
jgi:hypothetical protein